MNRKIIVNSNCYHGYSVDEALEGIANAGFTGIELTATKGWTEHVFPTMEFKELQRIKDKITELGLEVVSMSGHCNLMDRNRLPDFVDNIHLAHFFNAKFIVSSIGEAHLKDESYADNSELVNNINTFSQLLQEYNMTLVLEVHGEHGSGRILNEIVSLIDSDRVKIAYDTANALFYGDVNLNEDLNECVDNIAYIHLKDKSGERTEWNFPALGEGNINFLEVINILEANDNLSPLSIEIEFTDKGPKDLNEVNEALVTSRNYLVSIGVIEGEQS